MANQSAQSPAYCLILLILLGFSSCVETGEKAWERQPDVLLTKPLVYPVASNYEPVLDDAFFFVIDLRMEYGQAQCFVEGKQIELEECAEVPGVYDVPGLFEAYDTRRREEGGHAEVVFAAHPDVSVQLIHFLIRQFRLRGVFQFYHRVTPADGSEVQMALLSHRTGPYSDRELGQLSIAPLCFLRQSTPSQADSLTTAEVLTPFSTHDTASWDLSRNGGEGWFAQLLEYSEENDIWILDDGRTALPKDTFAIGGLGNHLRRMQELSDEPVRTLIGIRDAARYDLMIATMDQMILSGIKDFAILSEWEMNRLPDLRKGLPPGDPASN